MAHTKPKAPYIPSSAFAVLLSLLVYAIGYAYLIAPLTLLDGIYCPSNATIHGMVGSIAFFVIGGCIFIFCSACLAASATPKPDGSLRLKLEFLSDLYMTNRTAFRSIMLCGILFATVEWWDNIHAYYCLTYDKAILRTSAFQAAKALDWNGVTLVTAECQVGKNGPRASISLWFRSGDRIAVPLAGGSPDLQRRYRDLRIFLDHSQYSYKLDESAIPGRCPPSVYTLLVNWTYDREWNSPSICEAASIYCERGIGVRRSN